MSDGIDHKVEELVNWARARVENCIYAQSNLVITIEAESAIAHARGDSLVLSALFFRVAQEALALEVERRVLDAVLLTLGRG